MPPAFNLSQDQTLQFNPTNTHNSLTVILITSICFHIRVIAFNTFLSPKQLASRHPHLSVVQIVKELLSHRAVSFDPSAAERQDYEAINLTRQPLQLNFFPTPSAQTATKSATAQASRAFYSLINNRQ
jgi:hypothetical protein